MIPNNIYNSLEIVNSTTPNKIAFISLEKGEERHFSYNDLFSIIESKSNQLKTISSNFPVLLLYNDTVEFLTTFLACQRQGLICVPMFYPKNKRHFERLPGILKSSECNVVLTSTEEFDKIKKSLKTLDSKLEIFHLTNEGCKGVDKPKFSEVSFIQYTSGSTSEPKGVTISHKNLMHNQKMIRENFSCSQDSVILSWLPFYHDMGLIGNLLHTIYNGCTCILMKPSTVVKNPTDWLKAVQKYKVTHTGGPNFIYDICNKLTEKQIKDLDLSSLEVLYNGAEPVKVKTVQNFTQKFAQYGLREEVYKTCYGLAEATLLVTGGSPQYIDESISSGHLVSEFDLVFYNNDMNQVRDDQGEICISGDSVTEGYWNIDSTSYFIEHNNKRYFKTGDLGQWLNGQLVVNGRLKEMLIINGQNIFPYDLELAISNIDEAIEENGVSISEVDGGLSVFLEIKRTHVRSEDQFFHFLKNKINKELIDTLGVESEAIVFVSSRSLPRTSSGKIRRNEMYSIWKKGELNVIDHIALLPERMPFDLDSFEWSKESVENYLVNLMSEKLKVSDQSIILKSTLFDLGLSSIKAVELTNTINKELQIELDMERVFQLNDTSKVAEHLLDLKWLSSAVEENEDTEIEL